MGSLSTDDLSAGHCAAGAGSLDGLIDYLAIDQQSTVIAERWLKKSWTALQTLKRFPQRCPPAPENNLYPYTVRMLVVDRCLFLFRVDDKTKTVRVLAFRHASQRPRHLGSEGD